MATIVAASGGGTWTTAATWVGGVVPTAADDVQLTSTSGAVTVASGSVCRSLDCTGYTNTLTHPNATQLLIGDATAGAGSVALKLVAAMTYSNGTNATSTISFVSSSAAVQTVDFAGKAHGTVNFNNTGNYQMVGSTTQLSTSSNLNLTKGTLDTNGQTITTGTFSITGTLTRALTLGASTINITASSGTPWSAVATGLTLSAASSTINMQGQTSFFGGGGFSYGTVNFTSIPVGPWTITGANTFVNFTRTGAISKIDAVIFAANQTITGTLTLNGNSAINRLLIESDTIGTARTITAAAVVASNVDFQDITAAGAANWDLHAIVGLSGDCGGNSGITFTASAAQSAVNASGVTWSTNAWTSRVPLPQDNVSVAGAVTGNVVFDMPRLGRDVILSCTGNPLLNPTIPCVVYGSFQIAAGMTTTGSQLLTFSGRGTHTVKTNGVHPGQPWTFSGVGGSYTYLDGHTTTQTVTLTAGSVDTGNFPMSWLQFASSGTFTRALTLGTSTVTLISTATATVWNVVATGFTLSAAASTIVLGTTGTTTRTFAGAGLTYGTLNYTIPGSVGGLTITGANTFAAINFSDASNARTLVLPSNVTTVVTGSFNVQGTAGKLMSVTASLSGQAATLSMASGVVSCDYLSIKDNHATGGASFYAGANSTNVSGNTGWNFTAAPVASTGTPLPLMGVGS